MRIIVLFLFVCAAQSVFAVCQSNLLIIVSENWLVPRRLIFAIPMQEKCY